MIKNIVFDVGKVLVSFEPEQHLKNLGYDEITREIVMSPYSQAHYGTKATEALCLQKN